MAKRELLAADLGAIAGTVYIDLAGDGLTAEDVRMEAVEVRLYRDGGDGVFDGGIGGGDDTLIDTVLSAPLAGATPGEFRFDGLSPGLYYVQQDAATTPAGLVVPDPIPVTVVDDAGQTVQTIDSFDQTALNLNATAGDPTLFDVSVAPDAIGGVRKAELNYLAGPSNVQLFVDVAGSELALSSNVGTTGTAIIRYDGDDSGIALVPEGLGGVNLSADDPLAGVVLEIFTDHLGNSFDLNIYTDANSYSTVNVPYPAESLNNVFRLFVPFSEFVQGGGATAGADFTEVGAIELAIENAPNQDVRVTIFETRQSSEAVVANLQNFQPITLGNQVFRDDNNDGVFDPLTEVGIAGVDVELYQLTALGDIVDPLTQTPIAVTTTDADGIYQFTGVLPGIYAAVIPAREFDPDDTSTGAGTLVGFRSSDPAVPTAGANAKIDHDDDGRELELAGQLFVITEAFQLISGSEPGPDGLVNNTVDFGFVGSADLAIEKSFVSLDVDGATRTATFRVDVTNHGLLDATGITVVDTLPTGLTFQSIGTVADPNVAPPEITNTAVAGNVISWDLIDLASGEAVAFLVTVEVADGATGDHVNTVSVSGDQRDVVPENNTDTATLPLPETDLSIAKTVETVDGDPIPPATVLSGESFVYRLVISNDGPDDATGVTVVDTLPADVTFVSASINGGPAGTGISFDPGTGEVTAAIGTIAEGGTSVVLITATVNANASDLITNVATVTNSPGTDPDLSNNTSSVDLTVARAVDLAVEKTLAEGSTAAFGGTVTYEITVTNTVTSPGDARGFTVTDTLPAGLSFVPGSFDDLGTGVILSDAGQVLTFTGVPLAIGEAVTFSFEAAIAQDASDTLTNTAIVAAFVADGVIDVDVNLDNNQDLETIAPLRQGDRNVDLAVQKAATEDSTAAFGSTVTYEITVTNTQASPEDARGFTVTDTLPAGLTLVPGSFDDHGSGVVLSDAGQVLTFTGVPLAIGQSVTFSFAAAIAQDAAATLTNTAVLAAFEADGAIDVDINLDNNEDLETITPLRQVDLVVAKDDGIPDGEFATPGEQITYEIIVTNTGVSDAVNVNVTDTLPAGVIATSITVDGTQVTDNNPDQGILSFVLPLVPTGEENAVTVLVTALIGSAVAESITNTVTISGGGVGDPAEGNTASVTTQIQTVVDVAVTKTGPETAVPGGPAITYTLEFVNTGPSVARNVNVADLLPAGLTLQSVTLNGTAVTNTGTGNNVQFVIPELLVGEANALTAVITATIAPTATGELENTVTITATGDTDPDNDTSTVTTTLTPIADLGVTKGVSASTAAPGDQLTYTIVVNNTGPSTAAGVTVVDVLPTGLTFVSGTGPGGAALTAEDQTVTVNVGTLAPGASQTITIITQINAGFTGTISNPVTVATTTDEGDNVAPNTATATTQVAVPGADSASLSGRVFLDRNNNGIFEAGDLPLAGITVNLLTAGTSTVVESTTTDAQGMYTFNELPAGNYDIRVIRPPGLLDGLENPGDDRPVGELGDSTIPNLTLTEGQSIAGNDFGLQEAFSKRRFLASSP